MISVLGGCMQNIIDTAVEKTIRLRVLEVLDCASSPMTGVQISNQSGLTYKQTIDALNALFNHGKIERNGRKYWARWEKAKPKPAEADGVQMLILRYMTAKHE